MELLGEESRVLGEEYAQRKQSIKIICERISEVKENLVEKHGKTLTKHVNVCL